MKTTTNASFSVTVKDEVFFYSSMVEAGENLTRSGLIPDLGNPILSINGAMGSGLIKVTKQDGELREERKAQEIKREIKRDEPLRIKPVNVEVKEVKETTTGEAERLLKQLGQFLTPQAAPIDAEQVRGIIKEELSKQEPAKVIHEIKVLEEVKPIGTAHFMVPKVCALVNLKMNVYLYGASGAGKSHAAEQVAGLLNLDFYSLSLCSQTTKTELIGYTGPNGNYIETDFYKAFKNGGLFLLDEVDNGNPNILTLMNSAISNGFCSFPCGQVRAHSDFRLIAGANTIGNGGTIQFVGRNPLDGATKARFKFVEFPIDEALELEISPNKDFCKKVQGLRAKALKLGINAIITPRDSRDGGTMINHGFTEEEALNYCIFNKLSKDEANLLKS